MKETGPWETEPIVSSSEDTTGQASLHLFTFEKVHTRQSRDRVQANSDKIPD